MRTGCEPTRFGNEAKTIIQGDALTELNVTSRFFLG